VIALLTDNFKKGLRCLNGTTSTCGHVALLHVENTHDFHIFPLVVFLSSARPPKTGGAFFEGGVFLLVTVVRLEPLIRVRFFSIYAQARPPALPSHVWGGWARMCLGVGRRVGAVPLQREKGNLKCTKHSQKPKLTYVCTLKSIKIHNFIHFCIKFIHFDMHMHHFNNTPEPK